MSRPKPANPAFPISDSDLANAIAQIGAEIDHLPLRSSALARIMRETFHGSDAGGAWDWRMAYDLMQAAAVQVLLRGDGVAGDVAAARLLASRLLTETRRSEQQIRLQQFSTPLPFAAMVVRAAAVRKGETLLEPSAGTGALAAFATRAGATLSYSPIVGQVLAKIKLLFAPADRFDFCLFSANRPRLAVDRQVRNGGVCGCRNRSIS